MCEEKEHSQIINELFPTYFSPKIEFIKFWHLTIEKYILTPIVMQAVISIQGTDKIWQTGWGLPFYWRRWQANSAPDASRVDKKPESQTPPLTSDNNMRHTTAYAPFSPPKVNYFNREKPPQLFQSALSDAAAWPRWTENENLKTRDAVHRRVSSEFELVKWWLLTLTLLV